MNTHCPSWTDFWCGLLIIVASFAVIAAVLPTGIGAALDLWRDRPWNRP
jgi:hypothetical protein